MKKLICCNLVGMLSGSFSVKTETGGELTVYSKEINPITGEKRFILTLYFCPYCGRKLEREEGDEK